MSAAPREEAEILACRFHAAYERLAPSFGYETRKETRVLDLKSPNGRLMVAVAAELLPTDSETLDRAAETLKAHSGPGLWSLTERNVRQLAAQLRAAPQAAQETGLPLRCTCHYEKAEFCRVHGRESPGDDEPAPAPPAAGDVPDVFYDAERAWYRSQRARPVDGDLAALLRARFGPAMEALEMIARHPCGAEGMLGQGAHCGECAWCLAKEETAKLRGMTT